MIGSHVPSPRLSRPPTAVLCLVCVWLLFVACKDREPTPVAAVPPPPAPSATQAPVTPAPAAVDPTPPGYLRPASFAELVKTANPAVVNIYTKVVVRERGRQWDPLFPGAPRDRVSESLGTGFIIDAAGVVVTNHHVVDKAAEIRVRTSDGKEYDAVVVGTDPRTDIAVIEMKDAPPLPSLPLGDSDGVEVGEWVVAIGNALGLSSTVTAGIISAKGRSDVPLTGQVRYADFLQTDASINPGNSGGPLINLRGEVIGINAAVSREGQGIGFAIPINMAKEIVPQLRKSGKVDRSWLGIFVAPVTAEEAAKQGLPEPTGVLVTRVVDGGPAVTAGIHVGDVLVSFAGQPIKSVPDLRWRASLAGIGKDVPVGVRREGRALNVSLRLGRNPLD